MPTPILRRLCVIACMMCASLAWAKDAPEPAFAPVAQPFEDAGGRWGFRTADGKVAITPRFVMAEHFSAEGIAAVVDGAGWVYIDRRGRSLLRPFVFDNGPDPFSEGLARFVENGRIGFFDRHGTPVIPARFDFAEPFKGGIARVCDGCRAVKHGEHTLHEGGTWRSINRKGDTVHTATTAQKQSTPGH